MQKCLVAGIDPATRSETRQQKGNTMKMKHTQGPWRTSDAESGFPAIKSCEAAPVTVALIDIRYPNLVTPETRLANARLIATAPELLEALEQAEQVFNVETIDPMQAFLMIEKMRAKIAKAKGETV